MNITITIPNDQIDRVVNALCTKFGYQSEIVDPSSTDIIQYISNPQTRGQFARDQIIEFLKRITTEVELEEAKRSISVEDPNIV